MHASVTYNVSPITATLFRPEPLGCCSCGRRHLLAASSALFSFPPTPPDVIEKFHARRPDWYEKFFARVMDQDMRSYEAQISGYKAKLFPHLIGNSKRVLELGVGTGPNFKYYARADKDLNVIGIDPNKKMEKYARKAAAAAGLSPASFSFIQGVGEALPAADNSMDAVIGTIVLCSVEDVYLSLKEVKRVLKPGGLYLFIEHVAAPDGTVLRLAQAALDPLQQLLSDSCHLTRETGKQISEAGFSKLSLNMTFLSNVSLICPHVYGIAFK
ncbi:putative methyltransferase type 11, S-adenosyl-L-methionine-dependent methyltransferase [Dioscorea sansibarensis]